MTGKLITLAGIISVLIACSNVAVVECVDGRLFFLAYMNLTMSNPQPAPGIQQIFVSCINVAGMVRIQYLPLNRIDVVMLNSSNNFQYTATIYPDLSGPPGTQLPPSVIISAQMDISVQTNKAESSRTGGYLALPISQASTSFYVASYTPRGQSNYLMIAAPYATCIDVIYQNGPTQYREMYISVPAGTVYNVNASGSDMTGIFISSTQPIGLYTGLDCAYVPVNSTVQTCDHIIEQIPPNSQLGTEFIMSSFYGRNPMVGYQYRVISAGATNVVAATIQYNAATGATQAPVITNVGLVRRGTFYEGSVGRNSANPTLTLITCSIPCLVMQYGEAYDTIVPPNEPSSAQPAESMLTIPGVNHYTNDVTFSTSRYYAKGSNSTGDFINGITIIANQSDLASIMLDQKTPVSSLGTPVSFTFPASLFSGSPDTNTYAMIYASVSPGFHTVTSTTGASFSVYVYGSAPSQSIYPDGPESYAYLAGYKYNYIGQDGPITTGPWFNFNPAQSTAASPPILGALPPTPALTAADYPTFSTIYCLEFFTVVPEFYANLKTRNCSEAYYRYYMQQRFYYMRNLLLTTIVPQQCAQGMMSNMTQLLYYSQYTEGRICFSLSFSHQGSATKSDIFTCSVNSGNFISQLSNWCPDGYTDSTSFLKNNFQYTQGCSQLHIKPATWQGEYMGWGCPTAVAGVAPNAGNIITYSFFSLTILLPLQFILKYLR